MGRDIVEKLRFWQEYTEEVDSDGPILHPAARLFEQAANEIERLRRLVETA